MTTVTLAASAFDEALPNVSWTRLAVEPVTCRWLIRRSAKALSLDDWKIAMPTSAVGKTNGNE